MGIINKIKNKLKKQEYAVFITDNGKQHEIIKINTDLSEDKFYYEEGLYIKNVDKFSNLHLKQKKFLFGTIDKYYYFYNKKYVEPITLTTNTLSKAKNNEPFSAKILNQILMTKKYYDLNQAPNNSLDFLKDPKNIMFIVIGIGVIIYLIQGGQVA